MLLKEIMRFLESCVYLYVACNPKEQTTVQETTAVKGEKSHRIPKAFGSIFGFARHPDSFRDRPFAKSKSLSRFFSGSHFFCQRTDTVPTEKLILTD